MRFGFLWGQARTRLASPDWGRAAAHAAPGASPSEEYLCIKKKRLCMCTVNWIYCNCYMYVWIFKVDDCGWCGNKLSWRILTAQANIFCVGSNTFLWWCQCHPHEVYTVLLWFLVPSRISFMMAGSMKYRHDNTNANLMMEVLLYFRCNIVLISLI